MFRVKHAQCLERKTWTINRFMPFLLLKATVQTYASRASKKFNLQKKKLNFQNLSFV